MYALWVWFAALFLKGRVKVTLRNGQAVVYKRDTKVPAEDYRREVEQWRSAADRRLKLAGKHKVITVSSSDIVSVEVR